jgi:hypothetical protein
MANIFVHFEPFDVMEEKVQDGDVASQLGTGGDLPPYIIPNSPEADHWKEQYPHGKKTCEDCCRLASVYDCYYMNFVFLTYYYYH